MPTKRRITPESYSASSTAVRQIEPLLQKVNPQHPFYSHRRPPVSRLGIVRLNQRTHWRHGTTCSISSKNAALRVFFVYHSKPVIIARVLCCLFTDLIWRNLLYLPVERETLIRVSLALEFRFLSVHAFVAGDAGRSNALFRPGRRCIPPRAGRAQANDQNSSNLPKPSGWFSLRTMEAEINQVLSRTESKFCSPNGSPCTSKAISLPGEFSLHWKRGIHALGRWG
jgi:hypothetical protein